MCVHNIHTISWSISSKKLKYVANPTFWLVDFFRKSWIVSSFFLSSIDVSSFSSKIFFLRTFFFFTVHFFHYYYYLFTFITRINDCHQTDLDGFCFEVQNISYSGKIIVATKVWNSISYLYIGMGLFYFNKIVWILMNKVIYIYIYICIIYTHQSNSINGNQ